MDLNTVYKKTVKGEEAIRHRTDKLTSDLRMVLMLINGLRDVGTLRMVSEHCRDSMAPLFFLEDNGFIEMVVAQNNVLAPEASARTAPLYVSPSTSTTSTPAPDQYAAQSVSVAAVSLPNVVPPTVAVQQIPNAALQDKVANLLSYVSLTMGDDAHLVYDHIQAIGAEQEFQGMVKKLYTIISQYKGVKEAERFAVLFGR
jgi:hypothetical protein